MGAVTKEEWGLGRERGGRRSTCPLTLSQHVTSLSFVGNKNVFSCNSHKSRLILIWFHASLHSHSWMDKWLWRERNRWGLNDHQSLQARQWRFHLPLDTNRWQTSVGHLQHAVSIWEARAVHFPTELPHEHFAFIEIFSNTDLIKLLRCHYLLHCVVGERWRRLSCF